MKDLPIYIFAGLLVLVVIARPVAEFIDRHWSHR
jgi:hypothetical protein